MAFDLYRDKTRGMSPHPLYYEIYVDREAYTRMTYTEFVYFIMGCRFSGLLNRDSLSV